MFSQVFFCPQGDAMKGMLCEGGAVKGGTGSVIWTAQFEDEFPAQGRGSGHFRTLIRKCPRILLHLLIQWISWLYTNQQQIYQFQ